LNFLVLV
jgi:hypothetical protein